LIEQIVEALNKMSAEVVEVIGSVGDLEDGQYVDILVFIAKECCLLVYLHNNNNNNNNKQIRIAP